MGIFGDAINYIIGLGASVMLPLVIAILSIIVGVKVGKAIRAGLMVGVGFVGPVSYTHLVEKGKMQEIAEKITHRFYDED